MIRENRQSQNIGTKENPIMDNVKVADVVLHSFTLTKNIKTKQYDYTSDNVNTVDLNDGKRHKVRSHRIAVNDVINSELVTQLTPLATGDHSNITNASDYSRLGGFCPTCRSTAVRAAKQKFPNDVNIKALKD